ncbi:TadE/TadG family type IV pilus assembly protein [Paenibacillus sp. N3.4]|uniref:TadE/TadG family type IV pilus assembly protein n=1 Tax=Paenibacillus sp. N3.4 TaxID=2603222 RepID=UPI0011C95AF3|nr:TadE/TadG family type IV pilus assembly protein [Paenibacillus sp. N3.4]TXK85410.1 pilus assembly protein [Paenibacillus sp. N3.4]
MLKKFYREQRGSMVMEASLLLPFFLAFVFGLIICIRMAILEMALQAGVSEAAKTISGQLYPIRLLIQEAKTKYEQSSASEMMNSAIERVQAAREKVTTSEDLADEYAAYIPDPLLELIKWEKEKREYVEGKGQEEWDSVYELQVKPRIMAAFTPVVYEFCDKAAIGKNTFKVIAVTLPSMENGGSAYFSVEAQISYKLPIPFMSQTLILKKKAFERAWVGA